MAVLKLLPHILSWAGIVLVLLRGFCGHRSVVTVASISGVVTGVVGTFALFRSLSGTMVYGIITSILGVFFLFLWGFSVAAVYRSTGRGIGVLRLQRFVDTSLCAGVVSTVAGLMSGAVCSCRLPAAGSSVLDIVILVLTSSALSYALATAVAALETQLPESFTVSLSGIATAVVALLLFSSSSIIRLDLFSPLSMKVMKFAHDFVHQFMESMLIPDHVFIQSYLWRYIGLLFGKEIGFWGGLFIWFTPVFLVLFAVRFERLPSVAHIRQGVQRRKLLAAAIRTRRLRLATPLVSLVVFAAAAYQSHFPSVEYWDPKPIAVTATPTGEIIIPKKGEVSLEDGKLHKYLFKQGEKEVRFFVLLGPSGQLTVDLDACAICKPDGYGQTEGAVICYYCKTLIPLETVGKPGGCNPVPVRFTENDDGVHIDGLTLINDWNNTVQATTKVKEGRR
jgi:uncharacterized membrane protein